MFRKSFWGLLWTCVNKGEENNKMFKNLFLLSVANVGVNVLMAALHVFSLGGIFY